MKCFVKTIFLIILLCSIAQAAMITSTASGDFSAGATWVGGVAPADTDGFTVAAGHTVVFDMDQSAWAGMAASVIAATGQLTIKDDAGTYYLKINGDLDLDGTMQAGTSAAVPFTGVFTIAFVSGSNSIDVDDTTGSLLLYCAEPTYKYVTLTAQAAATQKVMSVDTDISSDWTAGDTIVICDLIPPSTGTRDNEEDTIASMTANSITCTNNLVAAKEIGAVVVLVTRNIRLINSTDYAVKNGRGTNYSACEIYNCTGGGYNGMWNGTIGGCICLNAAVYGYYNGASMTFDCAIVNSGTTNSTAIRTAVASTTLIGSIIAGNYTGFLTCNNLICSSNLAANYAGFSTVKFSVITADAEINGCYSALVSCEDVICYADIKQVYRCAHWGDNLIFANCELGGSIGGVNSTYVLYSTTSAILYNVLLSATTEYYGYDGTGNRRKGSYTSSEDHDQVANAFKAWTLGGYVDSDTSAPLPTGETIKYIFTVEDTTQTYPVFRQFETTVQPGTAIEVEGYIAIPNGEDMTGYAPALQIIDKFADPLVDSTQSALDEDEIPDPDGSETGFQAVAVIWANQGDSPRQVKVRMAAEHDGGGDDVVIYGTWNIADYKDQINDILADTNELQTDLANGGRLDLLIDAILEYTGTTLPATIAALNNITADNVHDEVIEGTVTFRQSMRLLLSVMTGKSSGGGTATITFRDIADTKDRLSVTVDSSGNRTAVGTRDGT
ncbi:MAG: hypothetical protein HWN68_10045 [Desulfobacterales bacterium]|nr:hypothetical protein [Desulfobacterales bacterium]